jgi:2,3,4,5-tetrahydropyridine-2-carboxylate N-succinyltransferase
MMETRSDIIELLETGTMRSAQKVEGRWHANTEVKIAILEIFKSGKLQNCNSTNYLGFVDKHNLPVRNFNIDDNVRMVPGGSAVRAGAYIAAGVIIMPPSYVNIGAYVDSGSMIDSHVLVGSCAQIGKNVHLSAGVQIGGVLEPIGMNPVIVEDNAFIGAGVIIVEGIQIGENSVIAPGVVLSRGTQIFNCVENKMIEDGIIPPNSVVVPGSRPMSMQHAWGRELGLNLNCAIIIKYRDDKTTSSVVLENSLR